ncbi:NAD(P)H-dependent oxidoreductase [Ideonella sp. YS5]|uniref:NAD(P)H-dependent oxidoreductase n=1 Tax=Ideonella sp. YS5 TaxID=3453714 RepID=UPI003EEE91B7
MPRRILILQGHPDPTDHHFGHALADAYAEGAAAQGHSLRTVHVAHLDFPLLRSHQDWEHGELPPSLAQAQSDIAWAQHLLLLFPLWLGDMPALLKGFLEQVARPGFAFQRTDGPPLGSLPPTGGGLPQGGDPGGRQATDGGNPFMHKGLTGRSARIVVTMGMPALIYRWYFRAHSVKSLERNILGFVGVAPIEHTLIGGVGSMKPAAAKAWLARLRRLGEQAD